MALISQDTRNSATFTAETRAGTALISQDSKTTGGALWSSSILPWQLDFPWQWTGNGQTLTLDTRN